ncbi:hypothetical protein B0H16DRAFT_1690767 [Mycena metata]|uniref:Uncharacterized protein n=1 Tax=Mycena metata TaxID=1033252 RepID=A0AAD7IYW2_9AGAR|nr:hypothetical protein B0H16DRAFT_1690767 [Mycena metata]
MDLDVTIPQRFPKSERTEQPLWGPRYRRSNSTQMADFSAEAFGACSSIDVRRTSKRDGGRTKAARFNFDPHILPSMDAQFPNRTAPPFFLPEPHRTACRYRVFRVPADRAAFTLHLAASSLSLSVHADRSISPTWISRWHPSCDRIKENMVVTVVTTGVWVGGRGVRRTARSEVKCVCAGDRKTEGVDFARVKARFAAVALLPLDQDCSNARFSRVFASHTSRSLCSPHGPMRHRRRRVFHASPAPQESPYAPGSAARRCTLGAALLPPLLSPASRVKIVGRHPRIKADVRHAADAFPSILVPRRGSISWIVARLLSAATAVSYRHECMNRRIDVPRAARV